MDWVIHHKGEPPFYHEVSDIREWDKNFLEAGVGEVLSTLPASLISARSRLGTITRHNTDNTSVVSVTYQRNYSSVLSKLHTSCKDRRGLKMYVYALSRVQLVSKDGVRFTVDCEIVKKCMKTVKNLFDNLGKFEPEEAIPILVVNGKILKKVMDWVIHHKGEPPSYQEVSDIREWDKNFLEFDDETLSDIIEAANYLEMGDLLQLCYTHLSTLHARYILRLGYTNLAPLRAWYTPTLPSVVALQLFKPLDEYETECAQTFRIALCNDEWWMTRIHTRKISSRGIRKRKMAASPKTAVR
ncbi:hypothetical protein TSAR_001101 [Trichomalopsis sarcophagae]|uniref:SKP1 component POZ domain-containing protein n=1 Tax=Trichomalopsis sarcophagae TaxID=543379 RepID=A0A232F175_9HYME|nr:hypothetical protein TSAR_001101 [Trichomalopsis sarcophagae]